MPRNPTSLDLAASLDPDLFRSIHMDSGGTAAAPAIAVRGNTDTGFFSPATDQLGYSCGGTEFFRMLKLGSGLGQFLINVDGAPIQVTAEDAIGVTGNAGSGLRVSLKNSATASFGEYLLQNNLSAGAGWTLTGSTFSPTALQAANEAAFQADSLTAGMLLNTTGALPIRLGTNNVERWRVLSTGQFLINKITQTAGATVEISAFSGEIGLNIQTPVATIVDFQRTLVQISKWSIILSSNSTGGGNVVPAGSLQLFSQTAGTGFAIRVGLSANPQFLMDSSYNLDITQSVITTGSPTGFQWTGGAHTTLTASVEATDVDFDLARTVQFATGALATQRAFVIRAPFYAFVAASTITTAATLAITGAPVAGANATITNAFALDVTGTTRITGSLGIENATGAGPQYRLDIGDASYFAINGNFAHIIQHNSAAATFWSIAPRNGGDLDIAVTTSDPRPSSATIGAGDNAISIKANKNVEFVGNVGIGESNPTRAKLVVIGNVSTDNGAYGFLNSAGTTGTASGAVGSSIFADDRIIASEFNAVSDERVKDIIGVSDSRKDLEILRQIEITDFTYKGKKGDHTTKKVIGQQLAKVFPQAVRTITNTLPGGKEVDDFHLVDYEALSMLGLSSIQELDRRVTALENR